MPAVSAAYRQSDINMDSHDHDHDHDHDHAAMMAAMADGNEEMQHSGGISHDGMDHGGMDHGGMDHGGMDHGHGGMDHGGHSMPGMDHGASQCSMSMVWNYDYENLCLVFPSWRLTTPSSLYLSLAAIVLLGVAYEWLRLTLKRLDGRLAPARSAARRRGSHRTASISGSGSNGRGSKTSLLTSRLNPSSANARRSASASTSGGIGLSGASSATESDSDAHAPLLATSTSAAAYNSKAKPYASRTADAAPTSLFRLPKLTLPTSHQLLRSAGYATSVAFSFFLMLLFMTYNAYVIAAVVVGAGLGHFLFNRPNGDEGSDEASDEAEEADDHGMACH